MTCSLCGDVCSCVPDVRLPALPASKSHVASDGGRRTARADSFPPASTGEQIAARLERNAESSRPRFIVDRNGEPHGDSERAVMSGHGNDELRSDSATISAGESVIATEPVQRGVQPDLLGEQNGSWREEVSQRLHRYHARRQPRAPRYPSLRLKFDVPETTVRPPSSRGTEAPTLSTRQAVALDHSEAAPDPDPIALNITPAEPVRHQPSVRVTEATAKIIEFPKWSYSPPVALSDLADSVIDRPRILEAPEVVPPPPALGGITIEEEQKKDPERRPGVDMPLQSAPLEQRLLAVAVDALIVLSAGGIFAAVYYRIAGAQPTLSQILTLAGSLLGFFWIAYQYLLVVYAGTTPGLRAMKLQLQKFDGSPTNRRLRKWRVLGSVLSGISLGMGYAWQFLDEDNLCWHERVTKTYLAPKSLPER